TTKAESGHLITTGFLLHMLLYAVVPTLFIIWVRVKHRPLLQKLLVNTVSIIVCLAVAIALIGSDYGSFASMYREHRSDTMERLMPRTPHNSTEQYIVRDMNDRQIAMHPLGLDAKQALPAIASGKKLLTVIVVGETARAQNFNLYGY